MNEKQKLGRYGEERAFQYLKDRGYVFLDRNWRCAHGEIDLVMRDGNRLVFIEVKTRNGNGFGHPFEAITPNKIVRMRKLVAEWCLNARISSANVRLDAVAVLVRDGRVAIEHLKQVF